MQLLIDKNKFSWYMNSYHEPCFIFQQFMWNWVQPIWHNKTLSIATFFLYPKYLDGFMLLEDKLIT